METTLLELYIPNWNRFCDMYKPKQDFQDAFLERFSIIEDETLRMNVGKRINVELGILLLHRGEVSNISYKKIIHLFKEDAPASSHP